MNNFTPEDIEFYNQQRLKHKKVYKPKAKPIIISEIIIEVEAIILPKKKRNSFKGLPAKYVNYLLRAKRKNIAFEFSVEEFSKLTAKNCYYCGGEGFGIDRINSKLGYTIDNTVSSCTKCNMMKYIWSKNDFIHHIKKIYHYQEEINTK